MLKLVIQILTCPCTNKAGQPSSSNSQFSIEEPAVAGGKESLLWLCWHSSGSQSRSWDKAQGSGKYQPMGTYPGSSLILTAPRTQKQSSAMTWTAPDSKLEHLMFVVMVTSREITITSERRSVKLKEANERLRDGICSAHQRRSAKPPSSVICGKGHKPFSAACRFIIGEPTQDSKPWDTCRPDSISELCTLTSCH